LFPAAKNFFDTKILASFQRKLESSAASPEGTDAVMETGFAVFYGRQAQAVSQPGFQLSLE